MASPESDRQTIATWLTNVFVIGKGTKPWISLPKGNGIKLNIIENRTAMMNKKTK